MVLLKILTPSDILKKPIPVNKKQNSIQPLSKDQNIIYTSPRKFQVLLKQFDKPRSHGFFLFFSLGQFPKMTRYRNFLSFFLSGQI